MENKSIRAFFAVGLTEEIKQTLTSLINELQTHYPKQFIRWINPENLHITLQFIGQLKKEDVSALIEKTTTMISNTQSFNLFFKNLELFPSPYSPKVISIQVEPEETLFQLSKLIGEALSELDYPLEKKLFRAHLSLGRINDAPKKKIHLPEITLPILSMQVNNVILFESQSSILGVHYKILKHIPLQ